MSDGPTGPKGTTGPKGITGRRDARAARQLAYHRERMRWMEERMEDNTAVLEAYLTLLGEDEATLPGGRQVALDASGGVKVREVAPEVKYEQLELIPDLAAEADCPDYRSRAAPWGSLREAT